MYTIVNTSKCNFTCDHCLMCSGPKRKEMLDNWNLQKFMSIVGGTSINLVGGEVFLHPDWEDQLHTILSERPDMLRIVSNGTSFFTKLGNPTKKFHKFVRIVQMYQHSTEFVLLISNDPFHREELENKDYRLTSQQMSDELEMLFADNFVEVRLDREERDYSGVLPLGRAVETGVCCDKMDVTCYIDIEEEISSITDLYDLTMDWNGDLFVCCNMKFRIGNINDSEEELLENYHKRLVEFPCDGMCIDCKR